MAAQHLYHLYRRAGFGLPPASLSSVSHLSVDQAVAGLLKSSKAAAPLQVVESNQIRLANLAQMDREERKELRQMAKEDLKELNVQWMNRMVNSQATLREKMTLFWHGHFACRTRNAYFAQQYYNTLHEQALGNFGDILMSVSKTPAMLQFLNNQQNRKDAPNENFAREVMELFTLGRGQYREEDIKNAARAFTGWSFSPEGTFQFRERQHDFDAKTFMGKKGGLTGEDIIQIILEKPQTARYITTKVYRFFVNDSPDKQIIETLAQQFYQSGYNVTKLLRAIFTADWFYDPKNVGVNIKSPVELLVGLQNTMGIQFEREQAVLFTQRVLGQVLFYPPNVAGWPGGQNWIDSSSLLFRMRLAEVIAGQTEVQINAKEDGDVNTEYLAKGGAKIYEANIDWEPLYRAVAGVAQKDLLDALVTFLLALPLNARQKAVVQSQADHSNRENLIKSLSLALMCLPEYQLC